MNGVSQSLSAVGGTTPNDSNTWTNLSMDASYFLFNAGSGSVMGNEHELDSGRMAGVSFHTGALNGSQIKELYNCGVMNSQSPYTSTNKLIFYNTLTSSNNRDVLANAQSLPSVFGGSKMRDPIVSSAPLPGIPSVSASAGPTISASVATFKLTTKIPTVDYYATFGAAAGPSAPNPSCYDFRNFKSIDLDRPLPFPYKQNQEEHIRITGSKNQFVISSRFSAPGGPEVQSYGYLDAYSHEYSAYNHMVFRNYTVRYTGGRVDDLTWAPQAMKGIGIVSTDGNEGDPLLTSLSKHSGKFGVYSGSSIPSATYTTQPSIYKQQRNTNRRLQSGSTLSSPSFIERCDNMLVSTPIPRSEFQYKWITASLGSNYSYKSGKQRIFGYAPRDGILSSSVIIDGDSGYVSALTFPTASEIYGE
jgi:hypothetical protein